MSIDRMQLLGSGGGSSLYWDYSETQAFYLNSDSGLVVLSSTDAKAWFLSSCTNMAGGVCLWGFTPASSLPGTYIVPR